MAFLRKTGGGARDAALLLIRDKNGRYSLLRDPMYLDKCVIATDPAWQFYFEVQEVLGKDTYIFKVSDTLNCNFARKFTFKINCFRLKTMT